MTNTVAGMMPSRVCGPGRRERRQGVGELKPHVRHHTVRCLSHPIEECADEHMGLPLVSGSPVALDERGRGEQGAVGVVEYGGEALEDVRHLRPHL
jgi:hypothetical protein